MPIPDYQTLMLPLLRFAADGNDHTTREAVEVLATEFQLTPAERNELLASGQQAIFNNRVGWANSYLKKAGLLESPRRGALRIAARGKQILGDNPTRIDVKYLERFPEFIEFRDASRNNRETTTTESVAIATEQTPEEALELAHQSLRLSLAQDILSRILACSPTFFERLVVELLVKMGYGGSRRDEKKLSVAEVAEIFQKEMLSEHSGWQSAPSDKYLAWLDSVIAVCGDNGFPITEEPGMPGFGTGGVMIECMFADRRPIVLLPRPPKFAETLFPFNEYNRWLRNHEMELAKAKRKANYSEWKRRIAEIQENASGR